MDHYLKSDARLQASVSFGRFENDVLSWEKWSSFSPNKYLEEVGSLSTPGSVAQKRAYFEAHYKKIAAQKAEALEKEKQLESCVSGFVSDSSDVYDEPGTTNTVNMVEEVLEKSCESISPHVENGNSISFMGSEPQTFKTSSMDNAIPVNDEEVGVGNAIAVNHGSPGEEEPLEELNGDLDHSELSLSNDAGLNVVDPSQENFLTTAENQSEQTNVPEKHGEDTGNAVQKDPKKKKDKCLSGTRKTVVSPASRGLQASRNSRSLLASPPTSATHYLRKKTGTPQQPHRKNSVTGYSKGLAPKSLHLSMNSATESSLGDHSVMRKSLIMEKLGDKEIVRRAFRTFQKRDYASSSPAKNLTMKHESPAAAEPKMPISRTPVKVNQRLKKDPANKTPSGTRSNPLPSGSLKVHTYDKKHPTGFSPSSASTNSDNKPQKLKEFLKKLEANSTARASQNAHHNRSLNSKTSVRILPLKDK